MHGHVRVTLVDDGVHPQENRTAWNQVGRPVAEVSGEKIGTIWTWRRPNPRIYDLGTHSWTRCRRHFHLFPVPLSVL